MKRKYIIAILLIISSFIVAVAYGQAPEVKDSASYYQAHVAMLKAIQIRQDSATVKLLSFFAISNDRKLDETEMYQFAVVKGQLDAYEEFKKNYLIPILGFVLKTPETTSPVQNDGEERWK